MGRKYPNLKDRLYAAYNLIRYGKGKIRCMSCGKCGAVCKEIQMWNFEGDVYKVDPYIDADKTEN